MIVLDGLEDSFDNALAENVLSLSVGKVSHTAEWVRKSMYDFDLETPEGIEKLMALLPIMDPDILKDIMTEIWPGYPTDVDARRHRLEIKGFLKDYLEAYSDQEDAGIGGEATATMGEGNSGEEAGESEPPDSGPGSGAVGNPPIEDSAEPGTPPQDGSDEQVALDGTAQPQ